MKITKTSLLAVALVASAAACTKAKPEKANAEPPAAAKPPGAVHAPTRAILTIQDKLDSEKESRPSGTPHAEDVYAALEKAGLRVSDKQQHVASLYGAKYCLGAKAGEVAYSVCEYDSAEAAKAGRELTMKALPAPNRDIVVHEKTTLTVRQPAVKTASSESAAKTSEDVFARL